MNSLSVGNHAVVGASAVRYNDTRVYENFKKVMAILRQFMFLFFWLLSYKYMKDMELNNRMDINRRDFNLSLIELVLLNTVIMVTCMVVMGFAGLLLMR